jgi:Iron-binding zinc finger CDGSH type.
MKLVLIGILVTNASAFTVTTQSSCRAATSGSPLVLTNTQTPSSSSRLFAEGDAKINNMIDLESPKVVNQETLKAGEKKVYCRCWKSGTFPLCDAAHAKHNQETGDNVGPLIVSCAKEE